VCGQDRDPSAKICPWGASTELQKEGVAALPYRKTWACCNPIYLCYKKNPALIGPGSMVGMDSREDYWAVVLTHETRKGTTGCGTAVFVVVVVTVTVGKNGGPNPFA
jgi:hypothetical protein